MSKNRRNLLAFMVMTLLVSVMPSLAVHAQDSLIESVCMVTDTGKLKDGSFNESSYNGMVQAAEEFGLDQQVIETASQADYENNIKTCLDGGYDVVLTVGFLITDATKAAAEANPDVYFIGVDEFVADGPTNFVGLQFREDQAGFLAGALAAQLTKSNIIGGVYGAAIPPVVKYANGYAQGAKYINPDIKVLATYNESANPFNDPAGGIVAGNQEKGEGADVIFGAGGPTGSGAIAELAKNGVLVIGVDQDEYNTTFNGGANEGSNNLITSAMKRLDVAVYSALKTLVDGGADFNGGSSTVFSAANDGVGLAEKHDADVPDEATAKVEEILAGLKDGSIWTGVNPISGELLPTVAEALEAAGNFTTLTAAIQATGMGDMVDQFGAITIFAPTDEAFAALPAGALDALMADSSGLTAALANHVVTGAHLAADVAGMTSVMTVGGSEITITVKDDGVYLNDTIKVTTADILTRSGVIHAIDGVLLPAAAAS